jgi:hypothetical protein
MHINYTRSFVLVFLGIVLLPMVAHSYTPHVNVIEPYNATVYDNASIYVGKVGPGQTFLITISSTAQNATGVPITRGWNKLVATGIQGRWIVQNSSLYSQYLSVLIKPAPNTVNGTYSFYLTAINLGNYSKLGTVNFKVYVNVTPDVFILNTSPSTLRSGPGEPTNIYVTINNTGVSDNPFNISVSGLPDWNSTETVFALHGTEKTFSYPVYSTTPGVYPLVVTVVSTTSPLVRETENTKFTVRESVLNDYAAIGHGTLVFPIIDEPMYAVMYLLERIYAHL